MVFNYLPDKIPIETFFYILGDSERNKKPSGFYKNQVGFIKTKLRKKKPKKSRRQKTEDRRQKTEERRQRNACACARCKYI